MYFKNIFGAIADFFIHFSSFFLISYALLLCSVLFLNLHLFLPRQNNVFLGLGFCIALRYIEILLCRHVFKP